jgi:molybdate transport system substrate-binding protein
LIRRLAVVVLAAIAVAACTSDAIGTAPPPAPTQAVSGHDPTAAPVALTVFAASSLKGALDEVATAYQAGTGDTITLSTDSSAALETQIEQGAPADVFLSADTTNPEKLVTGGFVSGHPVSFAGNTLVIIVPKGNPAGIKAPFDLARSGLRVIGAGDAVPITKYATTLIQNLARQPTAPAAFASRYAANVVSREDNVKAVVAKIELGEGDAAIVYVTDAFGSGNVDTVAITPTSANVAVTYAGVVLESSAHQGNAAGFLEWLASPDGQAILSKFGFLSPS